MNPPLGPSFRPMSQERANITTVNGQRVKRSFIRKMFRNQKAFLEMFAKYQVEVRNLQLTIESRYKKLNLYEDRLNELANELQSDTNSYFLKKQQNQQMMTFNQRFNSNSFYQQLSPVGPGCESLEQFEENLNSKQQQLSPMMGSFIEPIIDIHEDDQSSYPSECNGTQPETTISQLVFDEEEEEEVEQHEEEIEAVEGKETKVKNSCRAVRKPTTMSVSSKTQFMQLVERHKRNNNLISEQVAENVLSLRPRDCEALLGYQCSISGCSYMHFLRAQVNRHYKNYHSKTCTHCSQRFKRPIDLLVHLNENKLNCNVEKHTCEVDN